MDRKNFVQYLLKTYPADTDFPWEKYPQYQVLRHRGSKKWFALVMDVPREKLGLPGAGTLDVVNFKCDPILIGSLRAEAGIFPAYHMNREHWITVALDGSVPDEKLRLLAEISFGLTGRGK